MFSNVSTVRALAQASAFLTGAVVGAIISQRVLQREYDEAGLRCSLANDEINVGIEEVSKLIRPDRLTHRPRLQVFANCERFIHGMTHWAFDEWSRQGDRAPKVKVRDVSKDFPDLARYMALDRPTYKGLTMSNAFASRRKPPQRGY